MTDFSNERDKVVGQLEAAQVSQPFHTPENGKTKINERLRSKNHIFCVKRWKLNSTTKITSEEVAF